jgi:hypothetical protein
MLNATSTMAIPMTSTARATRSYSSQCRVRMCPHPCSTPILRDWTVDGPRRLACDGHHIMSLSGASSGRAPLLLVASLACSQCISPAPSV